MNGIGLALLLSLGLSLSVHAQTNIIGGPGGGPFDDRCRADSYLVGVRVIAGKDMNQITATCQAFQNGRAAGPPVNLRTWGKWSSNGSVGLITGASCPPDTAVEGMQIRVSKVANVHALALRCRNPNAHIYTLTAYSGAAGGETGYEQSADCGGGAISDGLVGRSGTLIDAVGLSCIVVASSVSPPAAPPGPPPPPTRIFRMTVRTPATIYDKPDGKPVGRLQARDVVEVTSCDRTWCILDLPQSGAVKRYDLIPR